jgi:ssDNA-specific exonuclease RecJ
MVVILKRLVFALGGVVYICSMTREVYGDLYSLEGYELRTKYISLLKSVRYLEELLTDMSMVFPDMEVMKEDLKMLREELQKANVYRMRDEDMRKSSISIIKILEDIKKKAYNLYNSL